MLEKAPPNPIVLKKWFVFQRRHGPCSAFEGRSRPKVDFSEADLRLYRQRPVPAKGMAQSGGPQKAAPPANNRSSEPSTGANAPLTNGGLLPAPSASNGTEQVNTYRGGDKNFETTLHWHVGDEKVFFHNIGKARLLNLMKEVCSSCGERAKTLKVAFRTARRRCSL